MISRQPSPYLLGLLSNPPNDTARRVFYMFKLVGSFYGEWFSYGDASMRTPLAQGTLHRYLHLFVEEDVLEQDEYTREYRVKKKGG